MAGSRVSLNIDRRWDVISSAKRDEEDAASTGLARLEDMKTADPVTVESNSVFTDEGFSDTPTPAAQNCVDIHTVGEEYATNQA